MDIYDYNYDCGLVLKFERIFAVQLRAIAVLLPLCVCLSQIGLYVFFFFSISLLHYKTVSPQLNRNLNRNLFDFNRCCKFVRVKPMRIEI